MKRTIVTFAATAGLALAASAGPVIAGQVNPAAAATTCHSPTTPYNSFSGGGGHWYTASPYDSGNEVYDNKNDSTKWCQVAGQDAGGIQYTMFRAKGTSLCAAYSGPVTGPGEVVLAGCDIDKWQQNWTYSDFEITSQDQINNGVGAGTCLSSNKLGSGQTETALIMVEPASTGGCNGSGGQTWYDF